MTDLQSLKLPPGSPKTFWTELSLHSAGLSQGDQWEVDAIEKVKALFPNQGVQHVAAWLAALHPRAIEYLETAPVLALAASYGGKFASRQERAYIAMNWRPLMDRGAKLKDVMKAFNVAYPLRAISSKAIRPGVYPLLRRISVNVPPSEIAQGIPADLTKHYHWLDDVMAFSDITVRRARGQRVDSELLSWAMLAMSRRSKRGDMTAAPEQVADFLICNREEWNKRWTWNRAVEESRKWHEALANAEVDSVNDGSYDAEVDYGAFPDRVVMPIKGFNFEFVALRSLRALVVEGKAMHHCVASYYSDIKSGSARIYSVRHSGNRIATAEFRQYGTYPVPTVRAAQVKGVCNKTPPKEVRSVADLFARCMSEPKKALRGLPEATRQAFLAGRKAST